MRRSSRVGLLVAGLAVIALALAACSSAGSTTGAGSAAAPSGAKVGGTASAGGATVIEKKLTFTPDTTLTVKVGQTVTFKNEDTVAHDVLINYQDLGEQAPGQSVNWTPTQAGNVGFACLHYPQMTGTITVK